MSKYLEENGLAYFWSKIKSVFAKDDEVLHLTGGELSGPLTGTSATFSNDLSVNNLTARGNSAVGGDMNLLGTFSFPGDTRADGTPAYFLFTTTNISNFSPPRDVDQCLVLDTSAMRLYWGH